jgi:uncharacterized protein YegJ (DUF2314 family)
MVRVLVALLLLLSLVVGCKKKEEAAPAPVPKAPVSKESKLGSPVAPGTLKRASVETFIGVAAPAGGDLDSLEKLAREKSKTIEVRRVALSEMFGPDLLAYVSEKLAPADATGVRASSGVIMLRGAGTDSVAIARDLLSLARELADASHGWVVDPETFQIIPAATFHEHIPAAKLDVRELVMVNGVTGQGEQPFLESAGLPRYGFPELYVREVGASQISQMTHVINGVSQMLLDGSDVDARGEIEVDFRKLGWDVEIIEGGTGKARVKARWAKVYETDDDNNLVVELVPSAGEGPEGAGKLITECFGSQPDRTSEARADDPELLAAGERARAELRKLQPHFAKGVPVHELLAIKGRFTAPDGGVEWMWVDVVAFKGDVFSGTLNNVPQLIPSLHEGQKVKVKLADVADFTHKTRDGKTVGGYSIEIWNKRQGSGAVPSPQ